MAETETRTHITQVGTVIKDSHTIAAWAQANPAGDVTQ